jgi:PAS domain S-box-containing protein
MMVRQNLHQKKPSSHQRRISQLERALQETVERYELVFKATHDVLYDLDVLTGTMSWNSELCDRFGYPINEPANTLEWWVAHIHPDDALEVEKNLYQWFASTENTWQSEYRFRKENGMYSYVLDRSFVTRDTDGTPVRIIGSLFDITEQRELDRAKDEFISLVSHQLRTPLTIIRVYGEMFADGLLGPLTKLQSRHIARMTDASVRLIKLVNDILDVSRVELGHYAVHREPANFNQLVQICLDQVTPLASAKQISLYFTPNPACNVVRVDSTVVMQILDNLLVNAIRYTHGGTGHIQIACGREGEELLFSVTDNGIGIPKADQHRGTWHGPWTVSS